ncbi:hypothetical protein AYO44_16560 [Planctomycetaceae bacterium SCGC AG-212-F19]|nr:hypothetical protein AYO44_16560 [Planctomycetaceae bacterium SCGC AG-212-F19]
MGKAKFDPTPDQKREMFFNSLSYEIIHAFCLPEVCDTRNAFAVEVINFSRMAHARVLYTFLETDLPDRFKDDLLAADFGFPVQQIPLSDLDRTRINKDLLHLSVGRLRHSTVTKPWPDTIIAALCDPTIRFMDHVKSQSDLFPMPESHTSWIELINHLRSGKELRVREEWSSESSYPRRVITRAGDLPNGKPALLKVERPETVYIPIPNNIHSTANTTFTIEVVRPVKFTSQQINLETKQPPE